MTNETTTGSETTTDLESVMDGVRAWAAENEVETDPVGPTHIVLVLPGERKLKTTVSVRVTHRTAELQAFVIRHPDENEAGFARWLLRKNMKLGAVAFGIDHLGDVYLNASVPTGTLLGQLDSLLGEMLTASDESFNELLVVGFLTSMKKEWAWRVSRGESTRNLAAFERLLSGPDNEFLPGGSAELQPVGGTATGPGPETAAANPETPSSAPTDPSSDADGEAANADSSEPPSAD